MDKQILKHVSDGMAMAIFACLMIFTSCSSDSSKDENKTKPQPLNISVYLDLSDRLTRELTPSQMERDTAIINHLVDFFIEDCVKNGKIINSENHFQIFFFPSPDNSNIASLAKGLNVDMGKLDIKQKKVELTEMKMRFQKNVAQIYSDVLKEQDWIGSDVWSFFSKKEVDKLCIREGYRNILVILSDGYFYYSQNKIKEGSAYSYILPQTLSANGSLIKRRAGLKNLEVLLLEVNPYDPLQDDVLTKTIEKWFDDMEVGKYVVNKTNLPVSTETYIDNFLKSGS